MRSILNVPVKECSFPEDIIFPFAEARKLAIETMGKLTPPGLPPDPPQLALRFAEEAGEAETGTTDATKGTASTYATLQSYFQTHARIGNGGWLCSLPRIFKDDAAHRRMPSTLPTIITKPWRD